MTKILIVYVTTTGNTEKMANAIADGAKNAGADVTVKTVGETSVAELAAYDVTYTDFAIHSGTIVV